MLPPTSTTNSPMAATSPGRSRQANSKTARMTMSARGVGGSGEGVDHVASPLPQWIRQGLGCTTEAYDDEIQCRAHEDRLAFVSRRPEGAVIVADHPPVGAVQ